MLKQKFYILFFLLFNIILANEQPIHLPSVIIFDYDDTVTKASICNSICEKIKNTFSLNSHELKNVLIDFKKYLTEKGNDSEFWEKYAKTKNIILSEDWASSIKELITASIEWDPDMFNLVLDLKQKGFKIVCLSNICQYRSSKAIQAGYFDIFDETFFSFEIGYDKPDLRAYEYVLNKLNINPNECIFIDDSEENVLAAQNKGITGIVFTSKENLEKQLQPFLVDPEKVLF